MSSTVLWVSDASPLFFYSPVEEYFAGQDLISWVGYDGTNTTSGAAEEVEGGGGTTTYHSTTGPAGVVLSSIYATSFTPVFSASDTYNVSLAINSNDPAQWTSGQAWTGSEDDFKAETFTLSVVCGVEDQGCGDFVFQGAWVGTDLSPDDSGTESMILDDSSEVITYSGFDSVGADNETIQITSSDYSSTLSLTSTDGATAEVVFNGASIGVTGVVCPSCSTLLVSMDSTVVAKLNTFNNVTVHDVLLYFATDLDTSFSHTLHLEAQGGDIVIDRFNITGPEGGVDFVESNGGTTTTLLPQSTGLESSNSNSTSTTTYLSSSTTEGAPNAGVIVGAVLGSLAGLGLIWYICRRVVPAAKAAKAKEPDPWDEANMLQNMKNEGVHVTTAANQRYRYPGGIATSNLKSKA